MRAARFGFFLALLPFGCAAEMREPMSAAPAAEAPPPPPAAVVVAPAPAPPVLLMDNAPTVAATVSEATTALATSSRELEASANDCHTACRALGSMDRATGRLCLLAQSSADHRACSDAKTRVLTARGNVRATCVSCPGGVVVDPDAPCPSP